MVSNDGSNTNTSTSSSGGSSKKVTSYLLQFEPAHFKSNTQVQFKWVICMMKKKTINVNNAITLIPPAFAVAQNQPSTILNFDILTLN